MIIFFIIQTLGQLPYTFEIPTMPHPSCTKAVEIRQNMLIRYQNALELWQLFEKISVLDNSNSQDEPKDEACLDCIELHDVSVELLQLIDDSLVCDLIGKFHNYKVLIQVAVKNIFVVELPKLLVEFNYALLICSTSKGSVELYMPLRTNLEKVTAFDYSAITIQLPEFSGSSVNMKENKLIISDIRYLATWLFKFDISNEQINSGQISANGVDVEIVEGVVSVSVNQKSCTAQNTFDIPYTGFAIGKILKNVWVGFNQKFTQYTCEDEPIGKNYQIEIDSEITELWLFSSFAIDIIAPGVPVDCVVDEIVWTACSLQCGISHKAGLYSNVISPSINGGSQCPNIPAYQMCYIEETCPLMLPGVFGYSDTFGAALVINGSMRYNGKNNIINKGPFTIRFHFISHENMTTYGIEWIFQFREGVTFGLLDGQIDNKKQVTLVTSPVNDNKVDVYNNDQVIAQINVPENYIDFSFDFEIDIEIIKVLAKSIEWNKQCAEGCEGNMRSDGICQEACKNTECNFDKPDCNLEYCSAECQIQSLGDKVCNPECYNESCNFDEGDCELCKSTGCDISLLGNNSCDKECNNIQCLKDNSDCNNTENCLGDCYWGMVGDGFCNTECFVRQCDYDGGDCEFDPSTYCSPKCKKSMLRDGHCDPECLTFMCRYDRGDCESCVIGCPKVWLDDGICQESCNNAACNFDNGACQEALTCNQGKCDMNRIGNGMCDAVCLSSDCNFDGGDCECYLTGCEWYKVKDGVCNESCNNEVCKFDGGDCLQ